MTSSRSTQNIEYIIYGYQDFIRGRIGHNRWEVVSVVPEQADAIQTAERIYASNDYKKIEIKKKSFDVKSKRYISRTFKIFEKKSYKLLWLTGLLTLVTLMPMMALLIGNF